MQKLTGKIYDIDELAEICKHLKQQKQVLVLCHGCFDLLHYGHLRYFMAAKKMGHVLLVTVTPDEYVNKGPGRPVYSQEHRMEFIAALEIVDYVALNRWPSAVETIKLLRPDVFVKGSEYRVRRKNVNSNIFLEEKTIHDIGGRMAYTDEVTYSSSRLLHLLSAYQNASETKAV